jgi:hypothetical protein
MAIMLVSYDLNKAGKNYSGLIAAIQGYTHCKALKSAWLIETALSPDQIRDALLKQIDGDDALLVIRFRSADWASYLSKAVNDWLNAPNRVWG